MLSKLHTYINKKIEISETEIAEIQPFVTLKIFKKNDFVLKEGEFCDFIGFLNTGLIRTWYLNAAGKERTTQFIFEGCFFTYLESILQTIPSHKNFSAIEYCEILLLKKTNLSKILELNPKFEKIFRYLLIEESLLQMQTIENEREKSPMVRYLKAIDENPMMFNRIPIKYLASFLGVEPQSLSRIRKKIKQMRK